MSQSSYLDVPPFPHLAPATPGWVRALLGRPAAEFAGRLLLTLPFWGSGLIKLSDLGAAQAEMRMFGLEPALAFAVATILVQLGGSALILARHAVWLGAGALGVFTVLTIPLVHRFWAIDGVMGVVAFHTAIEHMAMIGGLILASILALRTTR